jgi:F-type H+-transporting ATPase subunit delta
MTVTAQNYALVLGELNLDEQQITAAETLLRKNPLLTQVLSDPRVRFAEKEKCLDRIFTPPFSSFMKVLCKHERVYALTEIFEAYRDLCRQKAGTVQAQLLCVEPPSAEQTEKMREKEIRCRQCGAGHCGTAGLAGRVYSALRRL